MHARQPLSTDLRNVLVDRDSLSFFISFFLHLALLTALGLSTLSSRGRIRQAITLVPTVATEEQQVVRLPRDFFISERLADEVGANSFTDSAMALSAAEILSDLSNVPSPSELRPVDVAEREINNTIQVATGLRLEKLPVRGAVGEGTTGAIGAIDRITQEILLSLEERKTLVVWLFDQSGSLSRQREEIRQRLDRIYYELGVIEAAENPAFKQHDDKPLLTSVLAFGKEIRFPLDKPTDNVSEIKEAVAGIEVDDSGTERVFTALLGAIQRYKKYRHQSPARNIMLVAFTDEVGDDQNNLDQTVAICRNLEVPVYVVGVPAPFGEDETLLKWVDPDPNYDQTPGWGLVSQGPESLFREVVRLRFVGNREADPMDSGFGPFALTRLCYETGGIYFAVHPNRNTHRAVRRGETQPFSSHLKHFFDPDVMRKYRPDYVPEREYLRRARENKARYALLQAADQSWASQLEPPQTRFVKRDEAAFVNDLTEAQKPAAKLELQLAALYELLRLGETDRVKETSPRWKAGFDLAMGRVMAANVRAQGYNAMLATAKRGLKFADDRNNTWQLRYDSEISTGSQHAKAAETASVYLQRVLDEHPGTPWALLARSELQTPLGWKWTEEFTDLNPPPRVAVNVNNVNNTPRPARNEQPSMLPKPPPKRPVPKL